MSAYASILRPGLLLYVAYREDGTRCAVSVPSGSTVARVKASFLRARRGPARQHGWRYGREKESAPCSPDSA